LKLKYYVLPFSLLTIEIEPKYCDIIITRFSNFTGVPEKEIRATVEHGKEENSQ
jgi:DNA modification methylase